MPLIAPKNFRIFSKPSTCPRVFGWNQKGDPNHCLDMVPTNSKTDDPPHHRITDENCVPDRPAKVRNRPTGQIGTKAWCRFWVRQDHQHVEASGPDVRFNGNQQDSPTMEIG